MKINIFLILLILINISCKNTKHLKLSNFEKWKLGWRMTENYWEGRYVIANSQFDSLLISDSELETRFLLIGLKIKKNLKKDIEINDILNKQSKEVLKEICLKQFLQKKEICMGLSNEHVKNVTLQMELIQMYIYDQSDRGNIMKKLLTKYNLSFLQMNKNKNLTTGNRTKRLKKIIKDFGFPNKKLIGIDAMNGVFIMIQHADDDKVWQSSQLENVKKAVINGDLEDQCYAYLYDRIKKNSNEKQLYGTQFSKKGLLYDVEDLNNLDIRRMKFGLMPIKMYKKLMYKTISDHKY